MKKVAFITHSFHKKTLSANIYAEELFDQREFLVDYFYIENCSFDATWIDADIVGYDIVIILQIISLEIIRKIKCDNIVFMPMYDFSYSWDVFKWLECSNLKILSMTKALHDKVCGIGLNSYYAKYYPEPLEYIPGDLKKLFLWQRISDININTTLELLKSFPIQKIYLHKAIDPFHSYIEPSPATALKYNIVFSEWFENRQQYLDLLKEVGIYIAPRLMEGGAAAFIDAMRMGKLVIANNSSAMNEYISHNETGILYDAHNIGPLDLDSIDLLQIQKNAYESVKDGRVAWRDSIPNILNFIESKSRTVLEDKTLNSLHQTSKLFRQERAILEQRIGQVEAELYNSKWYHFGKLSIKEKLKKMIKILVAVDI